MPIHEVFDPIVGELVSPRFFNGRLLTGTDLTREQATVHERDRRLGAAIGPGVLDGLSVTTLGELPREALAPLELDPGELAVHVEAGRAVTPGGDVVELTESTFVLLASPPGVRPHKTARAPAPLWTRADPPTGNSARLPRDTGAFGLYLLSLRADVLETEAEAPRLGTDRGTDICAVDGQHEALRFRLTRMRALETSLADPRGKITRNAAAHACLTATADDAASGPRRFAGLVDAADDQLAVDVPLAVVCIERGKIAWVDPWSVRRRVGPRGPATAEARLLQFADQLRPSVDPKAARALFTWIPPAGRLPPAWAASDAWAGFFGPRVAPPRATPCDPAILPTLLAAALTGAAIRLDVTGDTAPAVDVHVTRPDDPQRPAQVIYVRSTLARALVELKGVRPDAAPRLELVEVDGPRRWPLLRLAQTWTWASPNVPPGSYQVVVDSAQVVADDDPIWQLVGGLTTHHELTLSDITGALDVKVFGAAPMAVCTVTATHAAITRTARGPASRLRLAGLPVGTWTVQVTLGDPRIEGASSTRSADVEITRAATLTVDFDFTVPVRPPARALTVTYVEAGKPFRIKLAMIETSVLDVPGTREREVKPADAFRRERAAFTAAQQTAAIYRPPVQTSAGAAGASVVAVAGTLVKVLASPGLTASPPAHAGLAAWAGALAPAAAFERWDPTDEVKEWLGEWQRWLAIHEARASLRLAILAATPRLELERGATLLTLAGRAPRPTRVEAWAVFGPIRLPIVVVRLDYTLPRDYRPADVVEILGDAALLDAGLASHYTLDELASWPAELFDAHYRWPIGGPAALQAALAERAKKAIVSLEYVPGMTRELGDALGELAQNPTVLANARTRTLADLARARNLHLDPLVADHILAIARDGVPEDTWSLAAAGFPGAAQLATAGVETFGDLAGLDEAQEQELRKTMSAEAVQAARGQATERLVQRVVDLASHNLVAAASASGTTVLVATAGEEGTFDLQKPPNTPSAGMSATTHAAVVATAAAVATAIGALQQIHKPSDVGANALLTAALHKQSLVKLGRR